MSVLLMDTTKTFVRALFSERDVIDVAYYGGEFSSDDVGLTGFKSPAVLVAGLGWTRPRGHERMVGKGTRVCHMAAFVVTNNSNRADRMLAAQRLAEQLDLGLVTWVPANAPGAVIEVAAPEDDVRCENVYNKKIDAKGLALWLVTWRQCIKPLIPLPQIFELLSLDITSTNVMPLAPDQVGTDAPIAVTHEVIFKTPD
jgi:hypothetical protein